MDSDPADLSPRQPVLKRMADSRVEEVLPFRTDANVREEYATHFGGARTSKLLEECAHFTHISESDHILTRMSNAAWTPWLG